MVNFYSTLGASPDPTLPILPCSQVVMSARAPWGSSYWTALSWLWLWAGMLWDWWMFITDLFLSWGAACIVWKYPEHPMATQHLWLPFPTTTQVPSDRMYLPSFCWTGFASGRVSYWTESQISSVQQSPSLLRFVCEHMPNEVTVHCSPSGRQCLISEACIKSK